jgi:hypothetical protein
LFIDGSFDEPAAHELARSKGQQEPGHVFRDSERK